MSCMRRIKKLFKKEPILESHPIGSQDIYRLHYVGIYNAKYTVDGAVSYFDSYMDPFKLPAKMSREDAFKVLSYLTDKIEKKSDAEEASYESVQLLDMAISIKRFGFEKVDIKLDANDDRVIDLFTISGRVEKFKSSFYYSKYFEWYTENISLREVKQIYEKYGMEFEDLIVKESVCMKICI